MVRFLVDLYEYWNLLNHAHSKFRRKMKKIALLIGVLMMCIFAQADSAQLAVDHHPVIDMYDGWQLGVQIYTFKEYTFIEGLNKIASLGLTWVEGYPDQTLSKEYNDIKFNHEMPREYRALVKEELKSRGLRLVNYGVVELSNDETKCRAVFDFAKEMGIKTIVSEPPDEAWGLIDRLCQEYHINLAIHNHPDPSHYWNPDKILEACQGRSKYFGACADIGHWMRSGIKPLDALKKLEGRIISLHFGDLNEFDAKDAHDVAWGSGVADVKTLLTELDRQGFKGVFSVEFEYNWKASIPAIRKSVAYFNQVASQLQQTKWQALLDHDLSNWTFKSDSWTLTDGVLAAVEGSDIWTKARYSDFILDLEFKLASETNSGVFLRTGDIEQWLHTAIEVQILDSYGNEKITKHNCGGIFDCLEPSKNMVNKPGEWNRYTITCKANKIHVVLNGEAVIDMDLDRWTEAHKNPDATPNKFNTAYKDMPREGHIGLQYHGQPVRFRNI
jgi:sugar phosphate isomerase/epimerase